MKFLLELLPVLAKLIDWFMGKFWTKKRSGNGKNILLVEDNEEDAALAMNALREAGYETVWVKDKAAALDSMRRLRHRFVFIDVGLGRHSGWDVVEAIRLAGFSPLKTTLCVISGSEAMFKDKPPGSAIMTIEKSPRWEALVDAVRQAGI